MNAPNELSKQRVWDAPVRIVHWLLLVLIVLQYLSGEFELLDMEWHFWVGYATLALVLFRLLWGLFGSDSARFTQFLRGPRSVWRYARNLGQRSPSAWPGHNPLGGWAVLILLGLVLVQALSGLFASDDIASYGPLSGWVSAETSEWLTEIHEFNRWLLLLAIFVHVVAALFYRTYKREDLLAPMFSGKKVIADGSGLRFAGNGRALLLAAISIALVAGLIWFGDG